MSQTSTHTTISTVQSTPEKQVGRHKVNRTDIVLLTSFLRMVVFSYMSTNELFTKISALNRASRQQLLTRGNKGAVVPCKNKNEGAVSFKNFSERTVKILLKSEECLLWQRPSYLYEFADRLII
jgi:hypothetical protein